MTKRCEHCGSPPPHSTSRGQERRFCSAHCRVAARRQLIVTGSRVAINRNKAPEPAPSTPSSPLQGNQTAAYDTYPTRPPLLPEGSYRSLEAEASIQLDANGYPELPAYLDRRRPHTTQPHEEAA